MKFEWDENKRLENIEKRGVDFRLAAGIFENAMLLEAEDGRTDYGEVRYRAMGMVDDECYVVAYTWREEYRRIISAWKVGENGKRRYQALLGDRAS